MLFKRLLVLLWWCWPCVVLGQSGKLFTVETGLSGSLVTDIHQDQSGFIWIATEDGLNRFDGIKFTVYRHNKKDTTSLLNNQIHVLFADKGGRMYVGSTTGLQYYDPATDAFLTVPLKLPNGQLINASVSTICQRKNGDILVGTSGHGTFKLTRKGTRLLGRKVLANAPSELIIRILEDNEQNLWVSTEDKGLYRFSGQSVNAYFVSKKSQNNIISSICQDRYGRLFVGNMSSGLYRFDPAGNTFLSIPYNGRTDLPVADLLVNRNNQIVVATSGKGLKYFDPVSNKILELESSVTSFDFSRTKVNTMLEDQAGNIWIGIYQKGLLLLAGNTNRFGYIGYKSVSRKSIGASAVMALAQDAQGTVWVGTDSDGLFALPATGNASVHYPTDKEGGTTPSNILTIHEDSQQNLWLGSYLTGLSRFDRSTGKSTYINKLVDKRGDNVQRVFSIKEDARQRLWIGTMGSGIFRLDLRLGAVKNFEALPGKLYRPELNYIPNSWINCLLVTKDNKLFIGTFDGLGCLDLDTENFVSTLGTNRLMAGTVVYSLYEDNKGNLWIGTSQGLKKMNRSTKEITSFDADQGLPGNFIWAIQGDKMGDLWLSTNRGLSKMDVDSSTFTNFYSSDGLQGNEFSRGASLNSSSGELYFGGVNGISFFKPDEIRVANKRLTVRIVDLFIRDKPVKKGTLSGSFQVVDTTVTNATEFNLAHHDNSFTLEFSTMDFIDAERVAYQYSINDNGWEELRPGSNRLTFDNLSPGRYEFRLRAKFNSAVSEIRQVTVIVHPVWYLSTWAKLVYALLLLLLGILIARIIKNRRQAKAEFLAHQRQEEINEAKLQFFINIAHEIRTPLTLVVSPLQKLITTDQNEERGHLYDIMGRNTKRILDLVNQLMDIRKIEKGQMTLQLAQIEMAQFTKDVCQFFEEQIHSKQIQFILDVPPERIFARIDPHNFDKVLINVLSNAFKFTPAGGTIRVALTVSESETADGQPDLVIAIEDSGHCISELETERIFECFYQSEEHRGYNQQGTGIGLHLVKQLVELHGGGIRAENMDPVGCRFLITLPLELAVEESVTPLAGLPVGQHQLPELAENGQIEVRSRKKARRIVIADDDTEICNYLTDELSGEYTVFAYANGEDAYKGIMKEKPDLVVSDVMMPVMDGMALCRKLRANPLVNHIPVILLTAKTEESSNALGFELGADAYITKPFNIDILLKTIKSLIRNRQIILNNESEQQYQEEFISKVSIKSADTKLLEKVHALINKNMSNPDLSVEMIASEIGISRVHLHRKLKELTNSTTRDLIRHIRLKQAADLLTTKGLTVSEVAFATGFANANNFSVSFKELYGVSPAHYAEQQLKAV
ncbi:hybrid sensor histidine kinase/response regulator transcription factor [Spirosoma fluviale]|uniref:histidine kinase n=1 Tax=Spirosoma fluviale TaxID=1597977 RepID=A0A286FGN8_9BACT|nr:hybrid sensor histidine kinase/response regulator transcription factor [Spirosoma fluviale]SOD82407.1 ligand-binding sensor domain-containing protein [Spirosoma fluviale]